MRIALLPSSYLPESLGGTEIYVHRLAMALAEHGHKVAVVYHGKDPCRRGPGLTYETRILSPCQPKRRADLYLHTRGEAPPGFDEFLTEWKPDVVHFHAFTLGAGLDHARLAHRHGIPLYITYHTPTFSCARGSMMRWGIEVCDGIIDPKRCTACVLEGQGWPRSLASLLASSPVPHDWCPEGTWIPRIALPALLADARANWQEFMNGAQHIIACASWCKDVLVSNGVSPTKITIMRQALPGNDRERQLRLPLGKGRPLSVGFFGRFCRVKGPDLLLEAADRLSRQGLELSCELVGPIPENERRWAERLLARHKRFARHLGTKRGTELKTWLRSMDLIAIPSRCLETGPLTLLEAWDEGTPVVGSNLGGTREFLQAAELEALLFEPESPEGLGSAIQQAICWSGAQPQVVAIGGLIGLSRKMLSLYQAPLAAASLW
jgi:glycosyltransferase involved in cell wall biosynthesis